MPSLLLDRNNSHTKIPSLWIAVAWRLSGQEQLFSAVLESLSKDTASNSRGKDDLLIKTKMVILLYILADESKSVASLLFL